MSKIPLIPLNDQKSIRTVLMSTYPDNPELITEMLQLGFKP